MARSFPSHQPTAKHIGDGVLQTFPRPASNPLPSFNLSATNSIGAKTDRLGIQMIFDPHKH